jgi:hypothetical protein
MSKVLETLTPSFVKKRAASVLDRIAAFADTRIGSIINVVSNEVYERTGLKGYKERVIDPGLEELDTRFEATRTDFGRALHKKGAQLDASVGGFLESALEALPDSLKGFGLFSGLTTLSEVMNRQNTQPFEVFREGENIAQQEPKAQKLLKTPQPPDELQALEKEMETPQLSQQLCLLMNEYREERDLEPLQLLERSGFQNQERAYQISTGADPNELLIPEFSSFPLQKLENPESDPHLSSSEGIPEEHQGRAYNVYQDAEGNTKYQLKMTDEEYQRQCRYALNERHKLRTYQSGLNLSLLSDEMRHSEMRAEKLFLILLDNPLFRKHLEKEEIRCVDIAHSIHGEEMGISTVFSTTAPHEESLNHEDALSFQKATFERPEKNSWKKQLGTEAEEGGLYYDFFHGKSADDATSRRPFRSWYSLYCYDRFQDELEQMNREKGLDVALQNPHTPAVPLSEATKIADPKHPKKGTLAFVLEYVPLPTSEEKRSGKKQVLCNLHEGSNVVELEKGHDLLTAEEGEEALGSSSNQYLTLAELLYRLERRSLTKTEAQKLRSERKKKKKKKKREADDTKDRNEYEDEEKEEYEDEEDHEGQEEPIEEGNR